MQRGSDLLIHLYDRSATRAAIHQVGLGPRGQKFISSWLSAWQGNNLPSATSFSPERLRKLKHLLLSARSDLMPAPKSHSRVRNLSASPQSSCWAWTGFPW